MIAPEPPNPSNPFDWVLHILLFLFLFFVGTSSSVEMPGQGGGAPAPSENTAEVPTVIDVVEALILESAPVQLSLQVRGYQPDGCDFPVIVEQRREGNNVFVRIYRNVPIDIMCTMQLVIYDETIMLDGSFEPGTYTIDVNGVITEVTI